MKSKYYIKSKYYVKIEILYENLDRSGRGKKKRVLRESIKVFIKRSTYNVIKIF